MDSVLQEAERLLLQGEFRLAVECLEQSPPTTNTLWQSERRRLLAWATLATGETTRAYELFWSCAHHAGARAGILLLTVLAGQVETAVGNWSRHLDQLKSPPLELPDGRWHTPNVVLPALKILASYPFSPRSQELGAASVYQALLHQTQGDAPATFQALGRVTEFYPLASLIRDSWMDTLLCLPLPKPSSHEQAPAPVTRGPLTLSQRKPEDAVASAAQILLYPDLDTLQIHCNKALDEGRYSDALEALRRLLFLDPQHRPSLEQRWRLYLKLGDSESAKLDLCYLMDLYERNKQIVNCQSTAEQLVRLFPEDERVLLKMCFLQARLGAPNVLASYGRRLLLVCRKRGLEERGNSYRRWLLRQNLSLDDRVDLESR